MAFAYFSESLDPDESKVYTWPFTLGDGLAIASASVQAMNSQSTAVDATAVITIAEVAFGEVAAPDYAVTARLSGAVAGKTYTLRCRITDTNTPTANTFDYTMRLKCVPR